MRWRGVGSLLTSSGSDSDKAGPTRLEPPHSQALLAKPEASAAAQNRHRDDSGIT